MIHYITAHFTSVFHNYPFAKFQIRAFANGWLGVLTCQRSGLSYRVTVEEIKSEKEVEETLMFSDFEREVNYGQD